MHERFSFVCLETSVTQQAIPEGGIFFYHSVFLKLLATLSISVILSENVHFAHAGEYPTNIDRERRFAVSLSGSVPPP